MSNDTTTLALPRDRADLTANDMHHHIRWLIDARAITIAYQPIRELATGRTVGYEALARFRGVYRGSVEDIFTSARGLGLGLELELAAAAEALTDLPDIPGYLAVNLSPAALLDDTVLALVERAPADRLVIELTEHERVADYARLRERLRDLRSRGVRIAADDIGAGFAGLRHIAELRPDILKLDRSLVGGIVDSTTHRNLLTAMVAFAERENSQLVAEGVETRAELVALRELGVELGQGYLLGRPLPIDRRTGEPRSGTDAFGSVANVVPLALRRHHSAPPRDRLGCTG